MRLGGLERGTDLFEWMGKSLTYWGLWFGVIKSGDGEKEGESEERFSAGLGRVEVVWSCGDP